MDPFSPELLGGRRVLVTGGGTGLGRAMAGRFLALGADIVICGRRAAVLESTASAWSAEAPGLRVATHVCDIRDAEAVEAMMDAIWAEGPLDVLVNNAAATFIAQTHRLSARAADAVLAPTLHGTLYCTLAAGRRWIDGGRPGVVLSVLSTSVITGRAFTVASAMAKAGVQAMTRSLAVEWGPRNIRLVAVAPGAFPTAGAQAQLFPSRRAQAVGPGAPKIPLGRNGSHDELANLAAFMISDAAAYMTGDTVVLDGGAHLRTSGAEDLLAWSDEDWTAHRQNLARPGT